MPVLFIVYLLCSLVCVFQFFSQFLSTRFSYPVEKFSCDTMGGEVKKLTIDNGQWTIIGQLTLFICIRPVKYVGKRPRTAPKNLPRRGRGTARRRWMRCGTAFSIVGTMGAEGIKPSLTVGNGLCAVPGRGNDNPCAYKPEPPRHVIPSER